jgi:hypothetical protein
MQHIANISFRKDFGPLKLMASHPCISFLSTLRQISALFKQEIKVNPPCASVMVVMIKM